MAHTGPEGHALDAMRAVYGPFDQLTHEEARTWVTPEKPGAGGHRGRYLWTDAFGVVNLVTLSVENSSEKYMTLAERLVHTVHDILGRTRDGTSRLEGATDEKPLDGGLRIGKTLDHGDDCDGQYHHYLTLWMFALNRLSVAAKEPKYNDLAIQLAKAIHWRFLIRRSSGHLSMVWKISTDMKTVLVPSEGHLDAATGYVICRLLQDTAARHGHGENLLQKEIEDYSNIMGRKENIRPSGDPLDLGMGLWVSQIYPEDKWTMWFKGRALDMADELLDEESPMIHRPASRRLAFREFGACLGIRCCDDTTPELDSKVEAVLGFWEHHVSNGLEGDIRPISQVMYAAARNPGGKFPFFEY